MNELTEQNDLLRRIERHLEEISRKLNPQPNPWWGYPIPLPSYPVYPANPYYTVTCGTLCGDHT